MPTIDPKATHQTVITTFEVSPGTCDDVLEALSAAYSEEIARCAGFVSGTIHVNDARTRIATYSQWARREDYQAMLRSDEMRVRNRVINDLTKSFEPVMYDVIESLG